jgi:hypothetical protein
MSDLTEALTGLLDASRGVIGERRYTHAKTVYHGTSTHFLKGIMGKGLVPTPGEKTWQSDPDASALQPNRTSLTGIYVSPNLGTASGSAINTANKFGGDYLYIVLSVQEKAGWWDEDRISKAGQKAIATGTKLSPSHEHSMCNLWAQVQADPSQRREYEDAFTGALLQGLTRSAESPLHPAHAKVLRKMAPAFAHTELNRIVAYYAAKEQDASMWSHSFLDAVERADLKVAGTRPSERDKLRRAASRQGDAAFAEWEQKHPYEKWKAAVYHLAPKIQAAEQAHMRMLDRVSKEMSRYEPKGDVWDAPRRLPFAIGFRGRRNRIVAMYVEPKYVPKAPEHPLYRIYGSTDAPEFVSAYRTRIGKRPIVQADWRKFLVPVKDWVTEGRFDIEFQDIDRAGFIRDLKKWDPRKQKYDMGDGPKKSKMGGSNRWFAPMAIKLRNGDVWYSYEATMHIDVIAELEGRKVIRDLDQVDAGGWIDWYGRSGEEELRFQSGSYHTKRAVAYTKRKRQLGEASFGPGDIPLYFHLITSFPKPGEDPGGHRTVKGLAAGVLDGVVGIGANAEIELMYFSDWRNLSIALPGKETVQANKLTRVMYDNPHYLLSKDMTAFRRVWSAEADQWGTQKVLAGIAHKVKDILGRDFEPLYSELPRPYPTINSVKDLTRYVRGVLQQQGEGRESGPLVRAWQKVKGWGQAQWLQLWTRVARLVGLNYTEESEWIVKDKKLKIPAGSHLRIRLPAYPDDEKVVAFMAASSKERSAWRLRDPDYQSLQAFAYYEEEVVERFKLRSKYSVEYVSDALWKPQQMKGRSARISRWGDRTRQLLKQPLGQPGKTDYAPLTSLESYDRRLGRAPASQDGLRAPTGRRLL